jgi:diguanylate cyclase (GGDEF)-like protein
MIMAMREVSKSVLIWLCAAMLLAFARPALADAIPASSICHAATTVNRASPARWTCTADDWSIAEPRAFVRFELGDGPAPAELSTRLTRFAAMRITVVGADGRSASRDVTQAGMRPATTDWVMTTPLPKFDSPMRTVLVRIDAPRHAGMLSDMKLIAGSGDTPASLRHELLIALLCGTLCLPLLLNFAFYRVLRERFLLWHALSTFFMLAHTLVTSGLINRFTALSLTQLSVISSITVGGGLIAAAAFSADLAERDRLRPIQSRLLRRVGLWVAPWTAFYLFADGPFRALSAPLYLASFLPLMALFGWAMTTAWRRGSRAVKYQVAAWMPVMITAAIRIASSLGATEAPMEMLLEQHIAMGLEVIITFLGVFDRFGSIIRQRDLAVAEIRVFEDRAERDPLTALFNRRGVEDRFSELQAKGFRSMALIDLDRFKLVNDTHGHMTGDRVLRAAALALAPDGDTVAVRMGGEEFLLLLRGKDVADRAERRRKSIETRIAAYNPELGAPVTASMGFVEQPADDRMLFDFATLYAQCDRLLYEAKNAGRNRTMSERIQGFSRERKAA